jgi:predicted nucleotidyltransferase
MEELLARFKAATDTLEAHGIDYLVFGGIAVWAYGRRRKTRDIDILVRQTDAKHTLKVLERAGFMTERTDEAWLYKAMLDHASVDIIFEPKGEIRLTPEMLSRARRLKIDGFSFVFIDPENLVLLKILATKELRPADWYDALSILENREEPFDWDYFLDKAANYSTKVLSFLFLAEATHLETTGERLVPGEVIEKLIAVYLGGAGQGKSNNR